jgi:sulfopyruvate decarboxylase alpha subunit
LTGTPGDFPGIVTPVSAKAPRRCEEARGGDEKAAQHKHAAVGAVELRQQQGNGEEPVKAAEALEPLAPGDRGPEHAERPKRPQQHRQAARGGSNLAAEGVDIERGQPGEKPDDDKNRGRRCRPRERQRDADREPVGKLQEALPVGQPCAQARLHCREQDRLQCLLKASDRGWSKARRCVVKCGPAINGRPWGVAVSWSETILAALKENDIRLVTYVPDNVLTPLIKGVAADNYFISVPATREDEAVGALTGAYMGGLRGVAMMQTSGFALIANALASLVVPYQIPAVLVISERGAMGEFNVGQVLIARTMRPTLDSLGILHHTLADAATLRFIVNSSIKQAFTTQAPVALILSPLLTGGNPASYAQLI